MSEHRDAFGTTVNRPAEPARDLSRIAVQQARARMIAAAARPIAVKWRSIRRGDRFGSPPKREEHGAPSSRSP
jgi:hypothetical protein